MLLSNRRKAKNAFIGDYDKKLVYLLELSDKNVKKYKIFRLKMKNLLTLPL
jgi:hypothetical protein